MRPSVTISMPHWQVKPLLMPCLRSIRKHSGNYDLKVIVVDNGSRDDSLDYLRNLSWIELIERPGESPDNWPHNVFTAWDEAIRQCDTDFFVCMHTDVFVKSDRWLDPFFRRFEESGKVAAVGAWKLNLEHPLYAWQKQFFSRLTDALKGKKRRSVERLYGYFPRDFCAMYRVAPIIENDFLFSKEAEFGGGLQIMQQLWQHGFEHRMIPVTELAKHIVHIAHGSAAVAAELNFGKSRFQREIEKRVEKLFAEQWVKDLFVQDEWDR